MKNILPILFMTMCLNAKAQTKCSALEAFTGEWQYISGQDTIKMYFRYNECDFGIDGKSDIIPGLWGWHEYKKGNTVVESNYNYRFGQLPSSSEDVIPGQSYSTLLLLPQCDQATPRLIGSIEDLLQPSLDIIVNAKFNDAKNEIQWHQITSKATALPNSFILTKQ